MQMHRPPTRSTAARLLRVALLLAGSLAGARGVSAQEAGSSAPPPPSTTAPAPSPDAFQPSQSPLVVPPAPAPVAPQQPVYPNTYPPRGSYGSYPPAPGYPYAQRAAPRPRVGAYEHDGFFLRLNLGVGAGGMSYQEVSQAPGVGTSKVKTRGVAGVFEVAVGGRIVDNLILHGTLIAAGMSSYKTIDGVENRTYDDLSTRMALLGGGLTYYVMPTNLFITATVGGTYLEEERADQRSGADDRTRIESDVGVGTALGVGKEWWVGPRGQWGIGATITGVFYTAPVDIYAQQTWAKAHTISISFSATYN